VEIGPNGSQQFVLRDQFSGALDEATQYFERLRREDNAVLSSPKQGIGPIKPKLAKGKLACTHGSTPQSRSLLILRES
jgi:hypothetical protein